MFSNNEFYALQTFNWCSVRANKDTFKNNLKIFTQLKKIKIFFLSLKIVHE